MAQNKRAGKKSLAQNDFLGPLAPVSVTATDIGTGRPYNSGAASVSFSIPSNSPTATSFTVNASTGQSASGSSAPITVEGIPIGNVTFTVTAASPSGVSPASSPSSAISITTVPASPTGATASSGAGAYDTVSWSPPANGGKAITNYHITSSDGKTANTGSTSINIGQEEGTSQTYTIYADNANGRSTASSQSNNVQTFSFTPFSFAPFSFTPSFSFAPAPFSFAPPPGALY